MTGFTRRQVISLAGAAGTAIALSGCGSGDRTSPDSESSSAFKISPAPTEAGGPQAASCPGSWTPTYPAGFDKYEPVIKLSSPYDQPGQKFLGDDSFTDNPMANRLRDTLGIEYTKAWEGTGDVYTQKMQQAITSRDLPDVFHLPVTGAVNVAVMMKNQAVMDIKEIWEAKASPLVKELRNYPDGPEWSVVSSEGKLFGVPFTYGFGFGVDNLYNIRKDWLDQVGGKLPKTLDDLTALMRAFRDKGLGSFGIGACKNLLTYEHSLDPIFGAFGVMPGIWLPDASGALAYGSIQPGVKQALGVLAGWYKERLLDPDFFTKSEQDAMALTAAGKQGIYFAPWWDGNYQVQMERADKKVQWTANPDLPTGPDGKSGRKGGSVVDTAMMFRAGLDRVMVEASINQLNWSTEMHHNWGKYKQYGEWTNSSAWTEGYEYKLDGCKLAPGEITTQYSYVSGMGFNFAGSAYQSYNADVFNTIESWRDLPAAELDLAQQYLLSDPLITRESTLYLLAFNTGKTSLQDQFFGPATPTMTDKLSDLKTQEAETFIKIVTGNEPLDSFDDFVKTWKSDGGDKMTTEANEWRQANS